MSQATTGVIRISLGNTTSSPDSFDYSAINATGFGLLQGKVLFGAVPSGTLMTSGNRTITALTFGNLQIDNTTGGSYDAIVRYLSKQRVGNAIQYNVQVTYRIHDTPTNQAADSVGEAITDIADTEEGGLPIDNALTPIEEAPTEAALEADYVSLSPQAYAASDLAAKYAALSFSDSLFEDASTARYRSVDGSGRVIWLDTAGGLYNSSGANTHFSQSGGGPSAGISTTLADGWKVGFGIGMNYIDNNLGSSASGQGWLGAAGVTVGHDIGPLDASLSISGGAEALQMTRTVAEAFGAADATGNQTIAFGTATGRLSHGFPVDGWEIRPILEASLIGIDAPSLKESGAGPLDLSVDGMSEVALRGSASVDVSGTVPVFGVPVRPGIRLGASTWLAGNGGSTVSGAFQGVPSGTSEVLGYAPDNGLMGDVQARLQVATSKRVNLGLVFDGHYNAQTSIEDFGLEADIKF